MAGPRSAGGFVIEPRKLTEIATQFGRTGIPVRPTADVSASDPRFRAALFQHEVANLVRESLAARGTSLHEWVNAMPSSIPGLSYDRLVRIQRGETMMQLTDLFYWCGHFAAVGELVASYEFPPGRPDAIHSAPTP